MKLLLVALTVIVAVTLARVPLNHARNWNRGSYLILIRDGVCQKGSHARAMLKSKILDADPVNTIDYEWTLINGMAAHLSLNTLKELRTLDNTIELIEEDGMAYALADCSQTSSPPDGAWGIRTVSTPGCTAPGNTYNYPSNPGAGTFNYILDTGCFEHKEYAGRTAPGASFISAEPNEYDDRNGHGTHVAGTVAGSTVGMAFGGTIVAVKVLAGSGSGAWSGVISGIEWSADDADKRGLLCGSGSCKATSNLSLGGGSTQIVDDAVNAANAKGFFLSIAAGNNNGDACNTSPARATGSFTVGSTDRSNRRSSFSNYGTCNNIFAPGSSIYSATNRADAYTTLSGTSMAAPHVAGAAAILMASKSYSSVEDVKADLVSQSVSNCVTNPGNGSPNYLAFTCA